MRTDPFMLKKKSKLNPVRILGTMRIRYDEKVARGGYDSYVIPEKIREPQADPTELDWNDTAVVPLQMAQLLAGLRDTEKFTNTAVVEIGSFRGVTTQRLASNTTRKFFAIDPFFNGYGGGDGDYAMLQKRIGGLPHVKHLRKTSGQAFAEWDGGPVSFAFIDAVHDYANTAYDLDAWASLTVSGGIIALHDTDNREYAGTRRAAFEGLAGYDLYAHVENLVMLCKR